MSTRDERADATREALLRVARELFGTHGYAGVGTELIVERAGVTRGALYHHFDGKRELLRAVYEQYEAEVVAGIAAQMTAAQGATDPLALLRGGLAAFLDICTDRPFIQIALLDAPTVLGWAAWRDIAERYGLGLISAGLQAAMDAGQLRPQPIRPLAHIMSGAIDEAAMYIANAEDPAAARLEIEPVLMTIIDGLRP
ncbi:MAG TPA: TetR/AcrR family transcriptional regulator [Pseudonocardia sp.]|jgi:AcrR family transcriptional regulator|nr:TetR/AcrR family transcriptional regulator [Pseudonocardia sp.]